MIAFGWREWRGREALLQRACEETGDSPSWRVSHKARIYGGAVMLLTLGGITLVGGTAGLVTR